MKTIRKGTLARGVVALCLIGTISSAAAQRTVKGCAECKADESCRDHNSDERNGYAVCHAPSRPEKTEKTKQRPPAPRR